MKRTITLTETNTILSLRMTTREMGFEWCSECSAQVVWIEVAAAMEMIGSLSEIPGVHLRNGRVCSRSLIDQIKK